MQGSAILEDRHTATALRNSVCEGSALTIESESNSLSLQEYGTCFHGFLLGLCLEGTLALGLYGIYYVSHVIR
jgi:hypothetical protein